MRSLSFTRAHLSRVSFPGQPGRCGASTKVSRAVYSGASGSIQMKVMCPRGGYARKGGEWLLRVGEVVVVVCVCWATTLARSPEADSAIAQPPRFDIAKTLASRMQRLELWPGGEPVLTP